MYKKYAYIDCYTGPEKIPFKNPFVRFSAQASPERFKKRIEKRFPYVINKTSCRGIDGYRIQIPIITSINYYEDEEHIKKVIERFNDFIVDYSVNILILSPPLQRYAQYFQLVVAKAQVFLLLYVDKIVEKIVRRSSKARKDFTYVIIDGNPSVTEYILDILGEHINYLTLVTDTPSRFEEKLQDIYLETGLSVEVTNKSIHQQLVGDIVINCSMAYDKLFYCYSSGAYVIDFISDNQKLAAIQMKRKDLNLMSHFITIFEGERIENDRVAGLLLNQNRLIRNMFLYGYRNTMKESIIKLKNRYDIEIGIDEINL